MVFCSMARPEALRLLRIARRDLRMARRLLDPEVEEASWGWAAQRCLEKTLKAWLLQHGITRQGTGACSLIGGDQLSDRGSVSGRGRARESLWTRRTTEVDQACGAP